MNNYEYKRKQTKATSSLKYLLVLDFEATCEKDDDNYPNEIIEFPIVLVNLETLQVENGNYFRDEILHCRVSSVRETNNESKTF